MAKSTAVVPAKQQDGENMVTVYFDKIPTYAGATAEERAVIESRAAAIDLRDYETINRHGTSGTQELIESSEILIKQAERLGNLQMSFSRFVEHAKDADMDEVKQVIARMAQKGYSAIVANKVKAGVAGGALLAVTGMPILGMLVAGAGGASEAKKYLGKVIKSTKPASEEDLKHAASEFRLKMDEVVSQLDDAVEAAPKLAQDIQSFRRQRVLYLNDMGLDIAAGAYKMDQAKTELAQLNATIEETKKSGGNTIVLEDDRSTLEANIKNLHRKQTILYTAFVAEQTAVSRLHELEGTAQLANMKAIEHLVNSKATWSAGLAESMLHVGASNLFDVITKADALHGNIVKTTEALSDATRERMKKSIKQGAVDIEQTKLAAEKRIKLIQEGAKEAAALIENFTQAQKDMIAISNKVADAHREANVVITASITSQQQAARRLAAPANGNKKPLAIESKPAVPFNVEAAAEKEKVAVEAEGETAAPAQKVVGGTPKVS